MPRCWSSKAKSSNAARCNIDICFLTPVTRHAASLHFHRRMSDLGLCAKSNAFGLWEQCFQMLEALTLEAGSIDFRSWEQCFWTLKAMLYGSQGNDIDTRKACFQHPEAGLFASPSLWGRRLGPSEQPSIWLRPPKGERIPHSRRRTRGGAPSPSLWGRVGVGLLTSR